MQPAPEPDVRSDFDRLALLDDGKWSHNSHYHGYLLERVPSPCGEALEIGCGTGAFSRLLAERATRVLALDLSPEMIHIARERSQACANIDYLVADALRWSFPERRYDCVVSIATLHHLPLDAILYKMREAVRPGGMLLVLDLYQAETLDDYLVSAAAAPVSAVLRFLWTGRLRERPEVRAAWAEHGRHDVYPTLAEVHHVCARILPGARVRRHFLFRYSIVWRRTELGAQTIESPVPLPHPFIDHVRV